MLVPFIGVHDILRFMSEKGATTQGLKLAQTFLMTTRGTPLLYYGDELAMPGGPDPDNRRDFPGGFPNDARNAFEKGGRTAVENEVFEHLKRLIKLRADFTALRRGSLVQVYDEEQQTVYARVLGGEAVFVAINNDTKPATVEFNYSDAGVPPGARLLEGAQALGDDVGVSSHSGDVKLSFPGRGAIILTVRQEH